MIDPLLTERAVLGRMMQGQQHIDAAASLETGDFFIDSHRRIVSQIRRMAAEGTTVDGVTLSQELIRLGLAEQVGGLAYVAELTDDGWKHPGRTSEYVKIVKQEGNRRRLQAVCTAVQARAEAGEDVIELWGVLQAQAREAESYSFEVKPLSLAECVVGAWEEFQAEIDTTSRTIGVPTGIEDLDEMMGGWRKGELTYVGALPSRGKSAFMLQSMFHAASQGYGVGCISLEMRRNTLIRRLTSMKSNLPAYKFRDGRTLKLSERQHARQSMLALGDLPIQLVDHSGLKPATIVSVARQMHERGAKAIFVDFVQIIQEDGKDRREAINRVSAALRDAAKRLEIPFIVLSQLARRDADPNRRPTLQDLRESGNLEQDCHNALFLYRPKDKTTSEWTGEDEIIVEKQRDGDTGSIFVQYDGDHFTFRTRTRTGAAA